MTQWPWHTQFSLTNGCKLQAGSLCCNCLGREGGRTIGVTGRRGTASGTNCQLAWKTRQVFLDWALYWGENWAWQAQQDLLLYSTSVITGVRLALRYHLLQWHQLALGQPVTACVCLSVKCQKAIFSVYTGHINKWSTLLGLAYSLASPFTLLTEKQHAVTWHQ